MNDVAKLEVRLEDVCQELERLSDEKANLEAQIKAARALEAKAVLDEMVSKLKALNVDPTEIAKALGVKVAETATKRPRVSQGEGVTKVKGVPKYRSSLDVSLTWTGKGRKPGWIQTFLDNGGNLEDWRIKD